MRLELITDWKRKIWRYWSVQLGFLITAIAAINPNLIPQMMDSLPDPYRSVAIIGAWLLVTAVRSIKQPGLTSA